MKFTIKKGNHYSWPPHAWPWIGNQQIGRRITFDSSASYDSAPYNGQDVNKLFGLSFGLRGVHWNSARFGWRWSNADQCVELLAYVYREGVRNWDEQLRFPVVAQVKPGVQVRCSVVWLDGGQYGFSVVPLAGSHQAGSALVPAPAALPPFGLTHGLYFGGELVCPHAMHVLIDRA